MVEFGVTRWRQGLGDKEGGGYSGGTILCCSGLWFGVASLLLGKAVWLWGNIAGGNTSFADSLSVRSGYVSSANPPQVNLSECSKANERLPGDAYRDGTRCCARWYWAVAQASHIQLPVRLGDMLAGSIRLW